MPPATLPTQAYEHALHGRICGIDEVGRGCLAGAVYAAAVHWPNHAYIPEGIRDSKQLSTTRRAALAESITTHAMVGIGIATVQEIDTLNILHATMLAMQRAYIALGTPMDIALIDGNRAPALPCQTITCIKGDQHHLCIAAASIVAKHCRDTAMRGLDTLYPAYGFARHAGYGTAAHLAALRAYGVTPQHRHSFRPVASATRND